MVLVRSYPLHKVATLPAWLLRWCSGHHARLVTGETRVRFRLGATCSSLHMRCVSEVKLHSCLLSDIYLSLFYDFSGFENISCYIVLIPCRVFEVMKRTYASKRTSHGMALVRSYPLRKVATLPAWLLRWCSGHHARLVTGETRVRFRLGVTCSSFHMKCV